MSKVFLGMSGGVDSAVSAYLLREAGHEVTGVYMKNWSKNLPGMKCPWAEDLADAKRTAVRLGIDFKVFDFEKEYGFKIKKQKQLDNIADRKALELRLKEGEKKLDEEVFGNDENAGLINDNSGDIIEEKARYSTVLPRKSDKSETL